MRKILSRLPRRTVLAVVATMSIVVIAFAVKPTAAPSRPTSTVLYTPVLAAGPGNGLYCDVLNVSTTTRMISMDLIDNLGVLIGHIPASGNPYPTPPGQAFGGGVTDPNATFIGYCKITVDGTSSDVRGEVLVNNGTTAQTIAAAPAY
jgi:hypothetical protein